MLIYYVIAKKKLDFEIILVTTLFAARIRFINSYSSGYTEKTQFFLKRLKT